MGAFAFSAWVFLAAFYREAVRRMALEARLSEMERSGAPRSVGLCCDMLCCAVLVGSTLCRTAPAMVLGEQRRLASTWNAAGCGVLSELAAPPVGSADFTATETREREPSISREVTSKAGRTPLGGSPAKPAAGGASITGGAGAATQAAAGPERLVGQVKDASAGAAGVEMAELKKEL